MSDERLDALANELAVRVTETGRLLAAAPELPVLEMPGERTPPPVIHVEGSTFPAPWARPHLATPMTEEQAREMLARTTVTFRDLPRKDP